MFKVNIICQGRMVGMFDDPPCIETILPRIPIKGDTICYFIGNEIMVTKVNSVWIGVDENNVYENTDVYVNDYEDCYNNPASPNTTNNTLMVKKIFLNDKEYEIEITWGTESYFFRVIGIGGFHHLPIECHNDMDKFKTLIVKAIENNHDLKEIEFWDGKINNNK